MLLLVRKSFLKQARQDEIKEELERRLRKFEALVKKNQGSPKARETKFRFQVLRVVLIVLILSLFLTAVLAYVYMLYLFFMVRGALGSF
ncbi:hypothetical protein [Borrelia sp. RT5S]|uniref:hypothetical protein n=1 Tax=Borrelia sp. RT5S TaxID=2898581 RepID=UPI001E41D705|nr:hypothetical protein [Borrelia sp. RT5S]UGQ16700.1 hypothetical protein LSO06_05115 [Borrelia sp. RT5S]